MTQQRMTAAWRREIVPVAVIVLVIAAIQLSLPDAVTYFPRWLIPAIEVVGAPLALMLLRAGTGPGRRLHAAIYAYLIFLILASVLKAVMLLIALLTGEDTNGQTLLFAGFGVLIINVLTFGVIYWFLDGGGPVVRADDEVTRWDFQFPQQASDMKDWIPGLADYLYAAYTNIFAFSPTDTMPLTHRAKLLFTIQSAASLITIMVTVSVAINLIN